MTEHARMTTHLVWRHEGTASALRALQWKSSCPIPCEQSQAGDPDSACITPEQRFCEKRVHNRAFNTLLYMGSLVPAIL